MCSLSYVFRLHQHSNQTLIVLGIKCTSLKMIDAILLLGLTNMECATFYCLDFRIKMQTMKACSLMIHELYRNLHHAQGFQILVLRYYSGLLQ